LEEREQRRERRKERETEAFEIHTSFSRFERACHKKHVSYMTCDKSMRPEVKSRGRKKKRREER